MSTAIPSAASHTSPPRTLLESELRTLCVLVARGCTLKEAGRYVGCKLSEIRHQRESSESFRQQLAKARIKANLAPIRAMQRAMLKDWRAAAWYLERTHPEKFGRRNHRAFTQKQASSLIKDLASIVGEEVSSPVVSERVCARIEAAVRYATHNHNDIKRTGPELRRAMRHHEIKSPRNRPTLGELPSLAPEPLANHAATPQPQPTAQANPPKPNHLRANPPAQSTTPKPLASGASPNRPPQPLPLQKDPVGPATPTSIAPPLRI